MDVQRIQIDAINMDAGAEDDVSFPLSNDQLSQGAWSGIASFSGSFVIAYIVESHQNPGLFFCRVDSGSITETRDPVPPHFLKHTVNHYLEPFGLTANSFKWKQIDAKPKDAPHVEVGNEIVYFLKAGDFIKIGKATQSAAGRITAMQTGCPYVITCLAEISGGLRLERSLHRKFKKSHFRGEWFNSTPEILEFIASIKIGSD